jgi:perosamine synthetase
VIPVYKPQFEGNEKKYVSDCMETGWISSKGKYVELFQNSFSEYLNIKCSEAVSNGTVALYLALEALGVSVGDEVIVPTFTYIASVNAIANFGATPVFVDSDSKTWQLSPDDVLAKITDKTKAILVVHLYGHPCEMDTLIEIAKQSNIMLIEDCAEALGSEYRGRKVGTFGDIATFSFFGNKTITCGEGGMVATNNPELGNLINALKNQGVSNSRQYWHDIRGHNYRMTNIQAAIGLAQLEYIDKTLVKKRHLAEEYKLQLADLPLVIHSEDGDVKHTYWMVSLLLDKATDRDKLMNYLSTNGVETRPLFYPVHTMPPYQPSEVNAPVAVSLSGAGFNLPSYPGITQKEIEHVCSIVKQFYN